MGMCAIITPGVSSKSEVTSNSRNTEKGLRREHNGMGTKKGFLEERGKLGGHPVQERKVEQVHGQKAKLLSKVATPRYTWVGRPNLIHVGALALGKQGV